MCFDSYMSKHLRNHLYSRQNKYLCNDLHMNPSTNNCIRIRSIRHQILQLL